MQLVYNGTGCRFGESIRNPLYNPHENALNPCFLASVLLVVHGLLGLFTIYQIFNAFFWNWYGPYKIKYSFGSPCKIRSVGIKYVLRIGSVSLQVALLGLLSLANFAPGSVILQSIYVLFLVTVLLVLPLHIIEPTRSVVSHASLLLYWLLSVVIFGAIAVVDAFASRKVFIPTSDASAGAFAKSLEIALVLNALSIYILEDAYYTPSVELLEYFDLNGWDASTVRNLVATLTFTWLQPTLKRVQETNNIELIEVPNIMIEMKSEIVLEKFKKAWASEVKRAEWWRDRRVRKASSPTDEDKELRPSLFLVVISVYFRYIVFGIFCDMVDMSCLTLIPFLMQRFIVFFADMSTESASKTPTVVGVTIAFGIYLTSVVRYFSFNQMFYSFFQCSFGIQSALTALVYEKAINLSPEARKEKSSGDIVNHVSVDVGDITYVTQALSDIVTIPLRLGFCLVALHKLLGASSWAGLITAAILVPLSSKVSSGIFALYEVQMKYKDERTRLTSEILSAIKSIKLYSWEQPMLKRLDAIRNKKELMNLRSIGLYNAGAQFLWGCIPFALSCSVYAAFSYFGKTPLVPSIVFPALSLFDLLADPILMLPQTFSSLIDCKVSMNRLSKYFLLEEMEKGSVKKTNVPLSLGATSVKITDGTFVWSAPKEEDSSDDSERRVALKNINFVAKKGQLTCIVGRVGSGKTTLIKSIVGEVHLSKDNKGSVEVNGTVAYCSQSPWILNASIRENILFGKKYNKVFYQRTVEACQLLSDFDVLPNGDFTLVGEKGISLSGGQKARVSLARAVYSKADIYLLDDVLSAVDAHVGKKITDLVLSKKGMLATKTLILATNSVKVLHLAEEIIFLKAGELTERGSYDEVMSTDGEISKLVTEFSQNEPEEEDELPSPAEATEPETTSLEDPKPFQPVSMLDAEDLGEVVPLARVHSHATIGQTSVVSFDHVYDFDDNENANKDDENKETSEKGKVRWAVFLEFFKACNWIYIGIWGVFYWAIVASDILGNYILKCWSEQNLAAGHNTSPVFFLSFYASTGILAGLLTFAGAFVIWSYSAVSSSMHFHDRMANAILRSPMSFFDTTPMGRILNRFSDDISVLDQQIIWMIMMFFENIMRTAVRLSLVIYNLPFMVPVIGLLSVLYVYYRNQFIPASRELKRLYTTLRSPVFSHLQESVNGVETLRAYNEDVRFIHINRKKVDDVTKVNITLQSANRWLSMRLQSIAALVVLASCLLILLAYYVGRGLSPAMVGFLLTYTFSATIYLNGIIRTWSETETKIVSIERLIEYGNLPSEGDLIVEDNRPEPSWPALGEIHFTNYSTRYRENLDPVLKNINLDIKPCEKIGIVGRTGAGKSSLTLALFRIIEATSGNISIDSVETDKIGLFDLRSQLNIIPQDAHAFEGTVRENLDPFEQFSDEELWRVLEMAHLKEHVESMKTEAKKEADDTKKSNSLQKADVDVEPQVGLKAKVLEGGSNLSSGQRQLLCLARALLKPSKVLVLDEATAAVDMQTDKIIQETIRSEFKDKTILTIAHRLDTIMDSDRVLVLDKGEVREFDTPANLLKNVDGIFYSLCKEGGQLDALKLN